VNTATILLAFALMLILEGVIPLLAPNAWRDTFRRLLGLSNGQLRFIGLLSILVGIVILFVVS
jgi:uncharacterized protein YjeT (DUF2065 family)